MNINIFYHVPTKYTKTNFQPTCFSTTTILKEIHTNTIFTRHTKFLSIEDKLHKGSYCKIQIQLPLTHVQKQFILQKCAL